MKRSAVRLAGRLVPPHVRDDVLGDLAERDALAIGALLDVAWHFHLEAWRDPEGRRGALALFAVGTLLLWIVPVASGPGYPFPEADPFTRVIAAIWSASHLTAAVAAGLLAGHLPWVPDHAAPSRAGAVLTLGTLAMASSPFAAFPAGAACVVAAWFGARARRAADPTLAGAPGEIQY